MNNKRVRTKAMAMAVAAAMAVELCPVTAFAVTGDQVAADGTYEGTAQAVSDSYWNSYNVSAKVTVKDGKIETVEVTPQEGYASEEDDEENESYFNKAYSGTAKVAGMKTKLENQDATQNKIAQVDTVSHATRTSTAIKNAVLTALQSAPEKSTTVKIDTTALEAAIVTAEGKTEADYTADSWKAMQLELQEAKDLLAKEKPTQAEVDEATTHLNAAVEALVKADTKVTVTLNKKTATVYKGKTTTLKATVTGADAPKVTFTSSNPKVAAVNKTTGKVTAKAKGSAVITAKCGDVKVTCKVTVKNPTLTLNKTSASVKVGKTTKITAKAAPSGKVTYKSGNKKIATVSSNGTIKGIKKGTAKVTVTCNGVTKTVKVTVK